MPTHSELRELAKTRLTDAETLLREGRFDAAAYMCGYVLELGLKACVCRRLGLSEYPGKRRLKGAFTTHNFEDLLLLAGLSEALTIHENPALFGKWSVVARWEPDWRYRRAGSVSRGDVDAMLKALREPPDGVLPWLMKRW